MSRTNGGSITSRAARLQADDRGVPAHLMLSRICLALVALALILIGTVMVFSASRWDALVSNEPAFHLMMKQVIFATAGLIICVFLAKVVRYDAWAGAPGYFVYTIAIILLGFVYFVGDDAYGAQRWVTIAGFTLQPSEFAKIGFIIVFASLYCNWVDGAFDTRGFFWRSLIFIAAPVLFLYATQSDLGTVLVVAVGIIAVLWIGGVPLRAIALGCGVAVALAALALIAKPYRLKRFQIWLDPWSDPLDQGFQVIRSYYAFAEGGVFGVGLGNSHEKFYLPMAQNDMIYSIIGEELGLIGAIVVLLLFVAFLYFGLRIAQDAPTMYGRLLAGGLTTMLVAQAFLNMGCTIGMFPLTGKPLPFISAGGSSLLSSFIILGLILSVSVGSNVLTEHERRRNNLNVISVSHDDALYDTDEPAFSGRADRVRSTRDAQDFSSRTNRGRSSEIHLASGRSRSRETSYRGEGTRPDVSSTTRTGYRSSSRGYSNARQRDFQRGSRR